MPGPGKVSKRPRPLVFAGGQRWSSVAPAIFGWELIPIAVSYCFPSYFGSNHSDVRRHPVEIGGNRWTLLSSDELHLRFRPQARGRAYPLHPQLDQAPNYAVRSVFTCFRGAMRPSAGYIVVWRLDDLDPSEHFSAQYMLLIHHSLFNCTVLMSGLITDKIVSIISDNGDH